MLLLVCPVKEKDLEAWRKKRAKRKAKKRRKEKREIAKARSNLKIVKAVLKEEVIDLKDTAHQIGHKVKIYAKAFGKDVKDSIRARHEQWKNRNQ